jgi:hypothetical protein
VDEGLVPMSIPELKGVTTNNELSQNVCGAMLGTCVVAFIQLLTANPMDETLHFAVGCFTLAIPPLTLCWIMLTDSDVVDCVYLIASIAGSLLTLIGVGACFYHYSAVALVLYLVSVAACLYGASIHAGHLIRQHEKAEQSKAEAAERKPLLPNTPDA